MAFQGFQNRGSAAVDRGSKGSSRRPGCVAEAPR